MCPVGSPCNSGRNVGFRALHQDAVQPVNQELAMNDGCDNLRNSISMLINVKDNVTLIFCNAVVCTLQFKYLKRFVSGKVVVVCCRTSVLMVLVNHPSLFPVEAFVDHFSTPNFIADAVIRSVYNSVYNIQIFLGCVTFAN